MPQVAVPGKRRPITAGDVLREDYLEPLGLTQGALAKALRVDRTTINEIVNDRRSITPAMALRLGHALNTTPNYWLNLQLCADLYDAVQSSSKKDIDRLPVLVR